MEITLTPEQENFVLEMIQSGRYENVYDLLDSAFQLLEEYESIDTINSYQAVIKQVISEYAKLRPSHGNIHLEPIFDDINNRYALMQFGWDRDRRVCGNLIYVRIENSKVLIEYDGIERGITQDVSSKWYS